MEIIEIIDDFYVDTTKTQTYTKKTQTGAILLIRIIALTGL